MNNYKNNFILYCAIFLINIILFIFPSSNSMFFNTIKFFNVFILTGWLFIEILFSDSEVEIPMKIMLILISSPIISSLMLFIGSKIGVSLTIDNIFRNISVLNVLLLLFYTIKIQKQKKSILHMSVKNIILAGAITTLLFSYSILNSSVKIENFIELNLVENKDIVELLENFENIRIANYGDQKEKIHLLCENKENNSTLLYSGYITGNSEIILEIISNKKLLINKSNLILVVDGKEKLDIEYLGYDCNYLENYLNIKTYKLNE